jgi:naphtho-gamma-pyrone polyketide synthase
MFLNNFSATGGNTSVIMEDASLRITGVQEDVRSTAIVAVSGKTKSSMIRNAENLIQYLDQNPSTDLPSLSYTTTARRIQYPYRSTVAGTDLSAIKASLKKTISSDVSPISSDTSAVYAFTGQGSHYSAMGKQLFDNIAQFKSDIHRFDLLAQSQGFPSILPLIDGSADIDTLGTVVVQLGAVCVQMALVRLWKTWGIRPAAVVGHSLGEYAAFYAAGVLAVNDTIFLAGTRAKLLETHCSTDTHAMLAVSASIGDLNDFTDGTTFEVACINGPKATVISGRSADIDCLRDDLTSKGTRCKLLQVPFAFHSAQLDPALEAFQAAAAGATYNSPEVPVISPLLSSVIADQREFGAAYMTRHCRQRVNFMGGLQAAKEAGVINDNTVFIDIGSHPLCTGMVKSVLGSDKVAVPSLRRDEDIWKVLTGSICALHNAGVDINWNNYHQDFPESHHTLRLPSYGWDSTKYWIEYTNDWTLTKGETQSVDQVEQQQERTLSKSTVQRVVEEKYARPIV